MKNKPKNLPNSSGVYLFKKKSEILYIGRAVNLKNRLSQYFRENLNPRIKEMVANSDKLEFKTTSNLLEAIILEANLIKKYWPKYNIKDKDNRSFLYLLISKKEDFPKPIIIRGREIEKFKSSDFEIFGPYQSLTLLKNALKIIRRIFPYSTCKPNQGKPCFDYQIGLCPGACLGLISKEDYRKNINNLILFLKGDKQKLLKKLEKENPQGLKALEHIQDVALISNFEEDLKEQFYYRIEGYDISHLAGKETYASMVVFENGVFNKNEYRLFKIKQAPKNDDLRALEETLKRRFSHKEWRLPNLIMVDGGLPQVSYCSLVLKSLNISIPLIGISKYQNDKLVFSKGISKNLKKIIESSKSTLLKVREEAHRFANKSSKRTREKIIQ